MTSKIIASALAAISALSSLGQAIDLSKYKDKPIPKAYVRNGGKEIVPDSQKGKIVVFNGQQKIALSDLRQQMDRFAKSYRYKVEFVDFASDVTPKKVREAMGRENAQVAVFVVSGTTNDEMYVVAPDSHWAIVNVNPIVTGAKDQIFAAARTRKVLTRAFFEAAGCGTSQYADSEMAPIKSSADLDRLIENPPMDVIMRADSVMRFLGMSPYEMKTYRQACQEGWAPKPCDQYRKAIWDEVHTMPSDPIKIKYDPKRDK